jgi:hypothetical protein
MTGSGVSGREEASASAAARGSQALSGSAVMAASRAVELRARTCDGHDGCEERGDDEAAPIEAALGATLPSPRAKRTSCFAD